MKKNRLRYELIIIGLLLLSIISYELLFCNSIFVRSILTKSTDFSLYVFSLPRIIVYALLFVICLIVKNRLINNAINFKRNKKYNICSLVVGIVVLLMIVYLFRLGLLNIMTIGILIIFINYLLLIYFFFGANYKINILLICLVSVIYTISCNTFHVLDEVSHVPTTYNVAHGNFSSEHVYFDPSLEEISILSNYKENENLFKHYTPQKVEITGNTLYLYDNASKLLHIPSAMGIVLSEKFNGTIMDTYYIGRLFSALTFLIFTTIFLKILKFKKNSFIAILTTPFVLLLAGTYSVDGLGFIFISMFIAYIFNIYKNSNIKKITKRQLLIIIILMLLVSLFKGATYSFVFLFLLLIRKKIPRNYKAILIISLIAIFLLSYITSYSVIDINNGDSRGGNTNISQQLKFLFSSPIVFIKVFLLHFLNTFFNANFYQQLINIYFFGKYSYVFVIPYIIFLVYMGISDDYKLNKKELLLSIIIVILIFGYTSTALYLGFTPVGETVILGYQPRYVFPFLTIILMCLKNNHINVVKKDNYESILFYIILIFNVCQFFSSFIF